MNTSKAPELALFPLAAEVNNQGHLVTGGCDVIDLAKEFGTPLYLFDESTLRHRCREFKDDFCKHYPDTLVIYASKAFLNRALALIFKEEGMGLDVVSGGELSIAHSVDFPLDKVYFHGNNKTPEELNLALDSGVGRIVVDNFYELELLNKLAGERGISQNILLRLTPGVDPHTHQYTTTGTIESKFGFPLTTGQAEESVNQALSASNLNLLGFHFHLGSPVPEIQPYELAMELLLRFAQEMGKKFDLNLSEFDIGGGFAVPYTLDSVVPAIADYARAVSGKLCQSGDILARDINLAAAHPGDIIAIPVCGAYSIPMSSNYNAMPRPAIVMVKEGRVRLIRRRETYQDLMDLDLI